MQAGIFISKESCVLRTNGIDKFGLIEDFGLGQPQDRRDAVLRPAVQSESSLLNQSELVDAVSPKYSVNQEDGFPLSFSRLILA